MKIFEIKDNKKKYGFLYYFPHFKSFYIELMNNLDFWDVPISFDSFIKNKKTTINSFLSLMWVRQRLIPPDRQNISEILKELNLESYDEYSFLISSKGRCVQDNLFIEEISYDKLPKYIKQRDKNKISNVVPISNNSILLFLNNKTIKKINMKKIINNNVKYSILLDDKEFFSEVDIAPGGFGIKWGNHIEFLYTDFLNIGDIIPLCEDDFLSYTVSNIVSTKDACRVLNCSRQNINDLLKRRMIRSIKKDEKTTILLKSELIKRNW